jgi:hypothetical protein
MAALQKFHGPREKPIGVKDMFLQTRDHASLLHRQTNPTCGARYGFPRHDVVAAPLGLNEQAKCGLDGPLSKRPNSLLRAHLCRKGQRTALGKFVALRLPPRARSWNLPMRDPYMDRRILIERINGLCCSRRRRRLWNTRQARSRHWASAARERYVRPVHTSRRRSVCLIGTIASPANF